MSFPGKHVATIAGFGVMSLAGVGLAAESGGPTSLSTHRALRYVAKRNVRGAELMQHVFRSADGTIYQLIRAVPVAVPVDAEAYTVTHIAASPTGLTTCSAASRQSGAAALVGTDPRLPQPLYPAAQGERTQVFTPNDISMVSFDVAGSGTLSVGRGALSATRVCGDAESCPQVQATLEPLEQSTCLAQEVTASCSRGSDSLAALSIHDPGDVSCDIPDTSVQLCDPAPHGVRLEAGQALVIVYRGVSSAQDFTVGAAAFGVDGNGDNAASCPAETVVAAHSLVTTSPSLAP